jgi:hypothetical protein
MKTIQYLDILKRALMLTWKNKFLWFFGFFIVLSFLISNAGANMSALSEKSDRLQIAENFMQSHSLVFLIIGPIFIIIILGFALLRFAAAAGIIKSVNNIAIYRQSTIKAIFSEVKKYIWQLFLLEVLTGIVLGIIFVILLAPATYLLMLKAEKLAVFSFMIAALIFAVLAVIAYYLRRYSYFYIILGNMKTKMALESAYALFGKNIRESLLMGVVTIAVGMAMVAIIFVFVTISGVVIISLALATDLLIAETGARVLLAAGAIAWMIFLLIVFSWYAAFNQTIWVLFFQEISLEKQKEKIIAEKMESAEKIPSPEAV